MILAAALAALSPPALLPAAQRWQGGREARWTRVRLFQRIQFFTYDFTVLSLPSLTRSVRVIASNISSYDLAGRHLVPGNVPYPSAAIRPEWPSVCLHLPSTISCHSVMNHPVYVLFRRVAFSHFSPARLTQVAAPAQTRTNPIPTQVWSYPPTAGHSVAISLGGSGPTHLDFNASLSVLPHSANLSTPVHSGVYAASDHPCLFLSRRSRPPVSLSDQSPPAAEPRPTAQHSSPIIGAGRSCNRHLP